MVLLKLLFAKHVFHFYRARFTGVKPSMDIKLLSGFTRDGAVSVLKLRVRGKQFTANSGIFNYESMSYFAPE